MGEARSEKIMNDNLHHVHERLLAYLAPTWLERAFQKTALRLWGDIDDNTDLPGGVRGWLATRLSKNADILIEIRIAKRRRRKKKASS